MLTPKLSIAALALSLLPCTALAVEPSEGEEAAPEARGEEAVSATPRAPVPFDKHWLEPFLASGPARAGADLFRAGDFAAAAPKLAAALAAIPTHAPQRNQARFLLASSHMNLNAWQAAGDLFEDLWSSYPVLAPYHAYYAARCRLRRSDPDGALTWAARVPAHTVPEAEAVLVKIDALIARARWSEVESEANAFLDRFPSGPRRAEARFHLTEAMQQLQRPVEEIAAALRRIWAEAPTETWATRADENLQSLAQSASPERKTALVTHNVEEWVTRGMGLFDKNQNAAAEAAFAAALTAPGLDAASECVARFHRAQSVWKQRQRPRAAPLFADAEAACQRAQNRDLVVRSLYQGARCLASAGERDKALALYARIESEFSEHRLADDARLRAAEVLTDAGDDDGAEQRLRDLPDRYPKGDVASEALWRLAFAAWRAGDWEKSLHWLDEDVRRFPREDIYFAAGRAHYWRGRIFEKQGAPKQAQQAYTRAAREYPLSVYALFALERMRHHFPKACAGLLHELRPALASEQKQSVWDFRPKPLFAEPGFLRAVELARLGLGSDARRELARLGLALSDNAPESQVAGKTQGREDGYWITAILLDRSRLWSASHAIPRTTLTAYRWSYPTDTRHDAEWRLAYPRAFPELVSKNGKANHVPEALQLAIMREESAFSPKAESFANALGLTQMLVRTAQRFAKWRVTRETLLDPSRNLEVGSRFLAFLLDHFNGSLPLSIAGYNAGEGAVNRWLRERGSLELDEFLETIPYDETRNYTKRVLASVFAYSWLYQHDRPVPALSFALPKTEAKNTEAKKEK
ncbi:MAG TPA: transglycosylase SLT domain-containing protein [Polyangia bacterium]|nr:transglycosylase SLT domain-containing protein [Polyangia bacterium]